MTAEKTYKNWNNCTTENWYNIEIKMIDQKLIKTETKMNFETKITLMLIELQFTDHVRKVLRESDYGWRLQRHWAAPRSLLILLTPQRARLTRRRC